MELALGAFSFDRTQTDGGCVAVAVGLEVGGREDRAAAARDREKQRSEVGHYIITDSRTLRTDRFAR